MTRTLWTPGFAHTDKTEDRRGEASYEEVPPELKGRLVSKGFQDKEGLVAVPLLREGGLAGVLACRLIRRAVKPEWIPRELAPRLQRAAAEISAHLDASPLLAS